MPEEGKPEPPDAQRLAVLEEKVTRLDTLEQQHLERHLKSITFIFQVVAVFLVAVTVLARIDVRDATKEMEHRFEVLAGKGLPSLVVQHDGTPPEDATMGGRREAELTEPLQPGHRTGGCSSWGLGSWHKTSGSHYRF